MRHRHFASATLALGLVALVDVLRIWLPSIITIFGQAASTPAELLGAFALLWFLLPLATPLLIRRFGARTIAVAAAVGLATARLALTAAPGGQLQLYLASFGLLAGLVWLAAMAAGTSQPVPALVLGLALSAAGHAVLDTYDLIWRGGWLAWTVSAGMVVLFVVVQALSEFPAGPGGVRAWLLLGPALLLTGMFALSPALVATAGSYLFSHAAPAQWQALFAGTAISAAIGLFVLTGLSVPQRPVIRMLGPLALVVGTLFFAFAPATLLIPAVLLAAAGLGVCLSATQAERVCLSATEAAGAGSAVEDASSTADWADSAVASSRRSWAAAGGMLLFALAVIVYYAAYDLGYPNGWLPVAVAALVAIVALFAAPARRPVAASLPPLRVAVAFALPVLGLVVYTQPTLWSTNQGGPPSTVSVVAYNIRMGFGLDGRFDLDALVEAIDKHRVATDGASSGSRSHIDVLALSEVDRGWLLNGGHDTLALLAARYHMPYVFAPAADSVWGDAVLSTWPIDSVETLPLPAVGAPTGAQALAVTLDLGGDRELAVVATHLQPPPGQGPVVQARAVARFAIRYAANRPLVVAGDLNTQPGEAAFAAFTSVGLVDALAASRPLPTSPADAPSEQIDHIFISPGLAVSDVSVSRSTASDHLPVAVTLTLPSG